MISINNQRGFTLVEMIVTMVLITALYAIMMEGFAPAIQFRAEIETEAKIKSMRESILAAYKDNISNVDAEVSDKLVFDIGMEIEKALPQADGRCQSDKDTFKPIARYLDQSSTRAHLDGYSQPICVYITTRQSVVVDGVPLDYHSVAIVSPGRNNKIDAGTTLSATGELTLDGDDLGVLLDGRTFVQGRYELTIDELRRVADAYQAYFQSRYQADSTRSISINYFSCGNVNCSVASDPKWDINGTIPVLGNTVDKTIGVPMDTVMAGGIPYEMLGLSLTDVTDGFGNVLYIQNRGDLCRNPNNTDSSLRTPPYTAVIYTTLPSGEKLSQTVVGLF